jgi:hypothetical protein
MLGLGLGLGLRLGLCDSYRCDISDLVARYNISLISLPGGDGRLVNSVDTHLSFEIIFSFHFKQQQCPVSWSGSVYVFVCMCVRSMQTGVCMNGA